MPELTLTSRGLRLRMGWRAAVAERNSSSPGDIPVAGLRDGRRYQLINLARISRKERFPGQLAEDTRFELVRA